MRAKTRPLKPPKTSSGRRWASSWIAETPALVSYEPAANASAQNDRIAEEQTI
jgi:hypothetical protein